MKGSNSKAIPLQGARHLRMKKLVDKEAFSSNYFELRNYKTSSKTQKINRKEVKTTIQPAPIYKHVYTSNMKNDEVYQSTLILFELLDSSPLPLKRVSEEEILKEWEKQQKQTR